MRVNKEIRAPKVRVINEVGEQLGVMALYEALALADQAGLDLVEVVGTSTPPVCKIIDFGKFRYDQAKREKESKKAQHQVKVKEVKISPNISGHDLEVKIRHAREFLDKGNKVKVSCMFRGREIMHPELGGKMMERVKQELDGCAMVEAEPKLLGKILHMILAPCMKKKKVEKPVTEKTSVETM